MTPKRILPLLLVLCLLGLTSPPARAENLSLRDTVVDVKIPAGWRITRQNTQRMRIYSGDERLQVTLWMLEDPDPDGVMLGVLDDMKKVLSEYLPNQPSPSPVRFNQYDAKFISGRGKLKGQQVSWELALIEMERPILVVALSKADSSQGNEKAFDQLLASLKPAAKPR